MRTKITDLAPQTGVFEGDLKYGRCNGTSLSKGDFPAQRKDGVVKNQPIAPLTLVQPRDADVWKRDPSIKKVKQSVSNSQHAINHLLHAYNSVQDRLKANIHITFGKQRL